MAQLGYQFDPNAVPADERSFDTIPAGTYDAQIVESEIVATKSGTGKMLKLTWEVISGVYAKRKVFDQLNIENQSPKAQEIGQRQLADICEATGAGAISDSQDLHYKPCMIRVSVEKQEGYDDKNAVKRVKSLSGNVAPMPRQSAPAPRSAPAAQPQRAAAGSRPWGNRA